MLCMHGMNLFYMKEIQIRVVAMRLFYKVIKVKIFDFHFSFFTSDKLELSKNMNFSKMPLSIPLVL